MANEEHLRILNEGVEVWNQWRRDNPNEVPDLSDVSFFEMNLSGANFSGTEFSDADFSLANLRSANLCNSNLFNANLSGACLCMTNFGSADLTRSRFILCNLKDAIVENAIVTYIDIQKLEGLPIPTEHIRVKDDDGKEVLLTGYDAREFFNLPSIVEVFVTAELSQEELGCYHFHLGEIHHEGVATGVYFIGHRYENSGSVLRFQGKSYDDIYRVLPDLLAPFRMAEAVDWEKTIQAIPAKNRGEAITVLAKMETRRPAGRWRLAERMAEIFRGYRQANVYQISEGSNRGLRIDVFTNEQIAERLSRVALPELSDTQQNFRIENNNGNLTLQSIKENYMSEQHIRGGHFEGCSFGDNNSLTNYFGVVDNLSTVEDDIKQKLKEAREAIENANLSDEDKADVVDELNKLTAELEKPEQNESRVKRYWNRIKEVAPTVASILASAVSLGKILGMG